MGGNRELIQNPTFGIFERLLNLKKCFKTRAEKMAQFLHSNEPKCLGPGFECLSNPMIFHTKHI